MARSPIYGKHQRAEAADTIKRVRRFARNGECDRAARALKFLTHRIKASTKFRLQRNIDRCRWTESRTKRR